MTTSFSLTRQEVRDFDRRAIEAGVPGIVLMENAGRGAVDVLMAEGVRGPVSIVCGRGNNGGDGFVMARHLAMLGKEVTVELASPPDQLTGDAAIAFRPLEPIGIRIHVIESHDLNLQNRLGRSQWIVDGLLGTGAVGEVRSPHAEIIETINAADRRIFAVDLPSGLDADTGVPMGMAVKASVTATFVARKRGFDNPASLAYTGPVHVVSIGVGLGMV